MQFEIKDKRSGKTLELYDGEVLPVFHVYKERGEDDGIYKLFIDADMANMIISFLMKSRHLSSNGYINFQDIEIGEKVNEIF